MPGGPDERARTRGLTIVIVTFLLAAAVTAQLKASLVPASNRVARDQQLVNSARALEQDNNNLRGQLHALQEQIQRDNQRLAQTSQQAVLLSAILLALTIIAAGMLIVPMAWLYVRYKRGAAIEVKV